MLHKLQHFRPNPPGEPQNAVQNATFCPSAMGERTSTRSHKRKFARKQVSVQLRKFATTHGTQVSC